MYVTTGVRQETVICLLLVPVRDGVRLSGARLPPGRGINWAPLAKTPRVHETPGILTCILRPRRYL